MATPELRPLGVGEILDAAIKLCVRHALTLAKIVIFVVAPVQVLSVAITASTVPDGARVGPQQSFQNVLHPSSTPHHLPRATDFSTFLAGQGAVAVLAFVTAALATAACFKAVSDAYLGETPNWRSSLRFVGRRVGPLLWLALLTTVLLILSFFGILLPIYLWVAWVVSVPALLTEDVRGRRALGRSFRLVRKRWWATFAAVLVGFLLAAIVSGIVQGLLYGLVAVSSSDQLVGIVFGGIAATVGRVLTTPFQAAIATLVYFDLRVRKEGLDLELLAQRVGVARPAAAGGGETATSGWPAPAPVGNGGAAPSPDDVAPGAGGRERPVSGAGEPAAAGQPAGAAPDAEGSGEPAGAASEPVPPFWPPPPGWEAASRRGPTTTDE